MNAASRFPRFWETLCRVLVLCLLPLVAACARLDSTPKQDFVSANAVLGQYETHAGMASARRAPITVRMSLRAGTETAEGTDSRRVTALLWSNGNPNDPIRLDVSAGVGAIVAHAREDDEGLILFLPCDGKAFVCDGESTTRALRAIGVPLPLDLSGLSALIQGRFSELLVPAPERGLALTDDGGAEVALSSEANLPGGSLVLSPSGLPLLWQNAENGWKIEFAYGDGATLPKRLSARNSEGRFATVIIKTRETPPAPFSERQLELTVPGTVSWQELVPEESAVGRL